MNASARDFTFIEPPFVSSDPLENLGDRLDALAMNRKNQRFHLHRDLDAR